MRVLHLLSQRPSRTGSGVTLEALVRQARARGWQQRAVVGVPADDPKPSVGDLPPEHVLPLVFERGRLDFPLPGMSDVMPYRSSRWSALSPSQLLAYKIAWREHLTRVLSGFRPDVVHTNHVWLLSGLVRDLAPDVAVVTHVHATGLRQMRLAPHLAPWVREKVRRNHRFVVLHEGHVADLTTRLDLEAARVRVVGAGYREEVFGLPEASRAPARPRRIVYAGKYSRAKGLPWLLDAFERVRQVRPDAILDVAGEGAGPEADALRTRMAAMPGVVRHGMVSQERLAELMRGAAVFVLPSFYEGLPLVLVEALACGCRLVCTRLPGVEREIAPRLSEAVLELVDLPRLRGPDEPIAEDLPAFVARLEGALQGALHAPAVDLDPEVLTGFTWRAVFDRVEQVWYDAMAEVGR